MATRMFAFSLGLCFVEILTGSSQRQLLRQLSYGCCAGYEPVSNITSHSRIDLDQQEMEEHLQNLNFEAAKAIYTLGGNSGATAQITVAALAAEAPIGAVITQGQAIGLMKKAAAAGATSIEVVYTSLCKDGGSATKDLSGCFQAYGPLAIEGVFSIGVPSKVQNLYRTLAGLSTQAQAKMEGQELYTAYRTYFGGDNYAHSRVMAALEQTGICSSCDAPARIEIAKKTTVYMNVWMYVIHQMEDAILRCKKCHNCGDALHAWDEAVAFYTGSLEGSHDSSKPGKLLYELADKLCKSFGTCTAANGRSAVNAVIIEQFKIGQISLQQGKCEEVITVKKSIVKHMQIPLVQGALLSAHKVANHNITNRSCGSLHNEPCSNPCAACSKEKAEGAAFLAAMLPRVQACSRSLSVHRLLRQNMNVDSPTQYHFGFQRIKNYFEQIYDCLEITCGDVGGIIELGSEYYQRRYYPQSWCPDPSEEEEENEKEDEDEDEEEEESDPNPSTVFVVLCIAGSLMLAAVCGFLAWQKCCKKNYAEFDANTSGVDPVELGRPKIRLHEQN